MSLRHPSEARKTINDNINKSQLLFDEEHYLAESIPAVEIKTMMHLE